MLESTLSSSKKPNFITDAIFMTTRKGMHAKVAVNDTNKKSTIKTIDLKTMSKTSCAVDEGDCTADSAFASARNLDDKKQVTEMCEIDGSDIRFFH